MAVLNKKPGNVLGKIGYDTPRTGPSMYRQTPTTTGTPNSGTRGGVAVKPSTSKPPMQPPSNQPIGKGVGDFSNERKLREERMRLAEEERQRRLGVRNPTPTTPAQPVNPPAQPGYGAGGMARLERIVPGQQRFGQLREMLNPEYNMQQQATTQQQPTQQPMQQQPVQQPMQQQPIETEEEKKKRLGIVTL